MNSEFAVEWGVELRRFTRALWYSLVLLIVVPLAIGTLLVSGLGAYYDVRSASDVAHDVFRYVERVGRLPNSLEDVCEYQERLDDWGRPFQYAVVDASRYRIVSWGEDARPGGFGYGRDDMEEVVVSRDGQGWKRTYGHVALPPLDPEEELMNGFALVWTLAGRYARSMLLIVPFVYLWMWLDEHYGPGLRELTDHLNALPREFHGDNVVQTLLGENFQLPNTFLSSE
ncbi:MAG TPA: hypothetical protein VGE52_12025 [Pirellulales bacterium]